MPKFQKGSKEAKEWGAKMKSMRRKRGGDLHDDLHSGFSQVLGAAGQPIVTGLKLETGLDVPNPGTFGFDLGHDVIAPELMKVYPREQAQQDFRNVGNTIRGWFGGGIDNYAPVYNNSMRGGLVIDPLSQVYHGGVMLPFGGLQHGSVMNPNPMNNQLPFQIQQYLDSKGANMSGVRRMTGYGLDGDSSDSDEEGKGILDGNIPALARDYFLRTRPYFETYPDFIKRVKVIRPNMNFADETAFRLFWARITPPAPTHQQPTEFSPVELATQKLLDKWGSAKGAKPLFPEEGHGFRRGRRGGSVGSWEGTVASTLRNRPYPMGGNTNNGVMRVPHAFSRVHMGRGVIDETFNSGYIAKQYNDRNLGANGRVSL